MAKSLKARLLAGGAWVFSGKIATAGSNLLSAVLLTRLLTAEDFGTYGYAYSMVMMGAVVAQLGLHLAVVRLVAEALGTERPGRARGAVAFAFRYGLLGNAALAVVLFAGGGQLLADFWEAPALALSLGGITLWLVLQNLQVLVSETFRGFQDLRRATMYGGVVNWLLTLAAVWVLWLFTDRITLGESILIGVVTTAISLVLGLVALRRRLRELGPAEPIAAAEVFGIALPLWASGVTANFIGQIDFWILGAFLPPDQAGVYFFAVRLVTLVSMSLMLVNLVVPPFIAELYYRDERLRLQRVLRQTATLAGLPALAVLGAFIVAGGPIMGLVGPEFRAGGVALALLSVGRLANVLTGSCGVVLSMTGHQKSLMWITVVTGVFSVGATWWAVLHFGMLGAATVSSVIVILFNVAMWLAARWHTGLWTHVGVVRVSDVRSLFEGRAPKPPAA